MAAGKEKKKNAHDERKLSIDPNGIYICTVHSDGTDHSQLNNNASRKGREREVLRRSKLYR